MKKLVMIHMLPTKHASHIYKILGNQLNTLYYSKESIVGIDLRLNQHLYFTSDEEIKEDDWFLHINLNKVFKCCKNSGNTVWANDMEIGDMVSRCKKIIATTDNSLFISDIDAKHLQHNLPQPSQAFIEKYVEEYNKGNVITDVLVEYKNRCCGRCDGVIDLCVTDIVCSEHLEVTRREVILKSSIK